MNEKTDEFDLKAKDWDSDPVKHDRAKAVADEILSETGKSNHLCALEYGSGTGLASFYLQPFLQKIVLVDTSKEMLEVAKSKITKSAIKNMSVELKDLITGPHLYDRFDLIYTLMALHHIKDIVGILKTFSFLLNPGGRLFIADLDKEDGSFHGEPFDEHNGFDRDELSSLAKEAGFTDIGFKTIFRMEKGIEGGLKKEYPIFLMKCIKK